MLRKQSLCLLSITVAVAAALLLGALEVCRADSLTPPGARSVNAPRAVQNAEVTVTAGLTTPTYFATVYNPGRDEYLVMWQGWGFLGSVGDIYAQRVTGAGFLAGDVVTVTSSVSVGTPVLPAAAYNSDRSEFLVVWSAEITGCLRGQRVSSDGLRAGASFTIPTRFNANPHAPSLVYASGDQDFLLTWRGCVTTPQTMNLMFPSVPAGGGICHLYSQILNETGMAATESVTVVENTHQSFVSASYLPGLHKFLAVWGGSGIYAQSISTTGELIGTPVVVITRPGISMYNPALSGLSARGEFLVAWESYSATRSQLLQPLGGPPSDIYVQRVLSDGVPVGDSFYVAGNGDLTADPRVIYLAGQDQYVVAWREVDPGTLDRDHYIRWLSPEGTPVGGVFPVGAQPASYWKFAIAGSDNSFFIVWEDERDNISLRGRILERGWWTYLPLVMKTN